MAAAESTPARAWLLAEARRLQLPRSLLMLAPFSTLGISSLGMRNPSAEAWPEGGRADQSMPGSPAIRRRVRSRKAGQVGAPAGQNGSKQAQNERARKIFGF